MSEQTITYFYVVRFRQRNDVIIDLAVSLDTAGDQAGTSKYSIYKKRNRDQTTLIQ